ncbi:unnamed protein product [Prorocentrum cordatum]|uniref:Importin subunit alpha n=1 Tax=Prorocentrum cordatum TaxID=2364126 RepID=A0ABN9UL85_9DINO|nr:unnamed protein product [Polarella glacialis]
MGSGSSTRAPRGEAAARPAPARPMLGCCSGQQGLAGGSAVEVAAAAPPPEEEAAAAGVESAAPAGQEAAAAGAEGAALVRSVSSKSLATDRPDGDLVVKRQKSWLPDEAAAPGGLRVRTAAGSVVVSLALEECAGMPVKLLRQRRGSVGPREAPAGGEAAEGPDSEKLDDFVNPGEVQEILMVASLVPRLDPDRLPIDQLDALKGMIMSDSVEYQLDGVTHVRKLISTEDPPLQRIIDMDIVPRLVQLTGEPDDTTPAVQYESLWALTNIAAGSSNETRVVVDAGALLACRRILEEPPSDEVLEQAIWAIGNIAGDSSVFRDAAHEAGVVEPLLRVLERDLQDRPSLLQQGAWALSNLCRFKPPPDVELLAPALPVLARLLSQENPEVQTDAAWATSFIWMSPMATTSRSSWLSRRACARAWWSSPWWSPRCPPCVCQPCERWATWSPGATPRPRACWTLVCSRPWSDCCGMTR